MPRFSIITPSYRQLEWLKLCVASVADQAQVSAEHIIQDAGSGEELIEWGKNRPLKLFVEQDSGMYDAVNRGLEKATGEFCMYLNCDEQLLPDTLRKVTNYFFSHPDTDVLFADAVIIDSEGNPLSYRRPVVPNASHTRLLHLNSLSCAMFFRRRIFEEGFRFNPKWKVIGDANWIYDLLKAGKKMGTLKEPLGVYTLTGGNLSDQKQGPVEADLWNSSQEAPSASLKLPLKIIHGIKKLAAGAYGQRIASLDIYTKYSPHKRVHFEKIVGHQWPGVCWEGR